MHFGYLMGAETLYRGGVWQPWGPARIVGAMATKSGGGTTGSGAPWTAQQFSAWKRREKSRLVKLRSFLKANFTKVPVLSQFKNQLVQAEATARTLQAEIERLASVSSRSVSEASTQALWTQQRRVAALEKKVAKSRLFKDFTQARLEEAKTELPRLNKAAAKTASLTKATANARRDLPAKRASLAAAQDKAITIHKLLDGLSKLERSVQQGPEMSDTTLSMDAFVDRCLADLEKKPPPSWVVQAATAYAKERAAVARKAQKEVIDNRKQLEKDSKELAGLQGSEAATLKRIEALERRLERENERVLAERKFIYTKLWNKKDVRPGLTQREKSFIGHHYWSNRLEVWAGDPKHTFWATKGVEFSAKLRTSARKIEELEADIKELKAGPERIRALKSSIRKFEKDIATADKANAAAGGWPKGKAPRIGYIANAHAFEKYMAEWMRWLGWDDAKAMPVGPDEGIDVKATGALGQAKHWDTEVGIEEVQRHNGVCEGIQKYGRVFLSKSGYTPQAIKWANDRDLPLFEMKAGSKDAGVAASTKAGEKLLKVGAKAMKGNKRN
jgi:hypothetical protein